jgi:hypothetical protein
MGDLGGFLVDGRELNGEDTRPLIRAIKPMQGELRFQLEWLFSRMRSQFHHVPLQNVSIISNIGPR